MFLEIAYDDSLQPCLTSSRGKIHTHKNLGCKFGAELAKVRPDFLYCFCHFLKFGSSAFLEIACNDSLQQVEVKLTEKIFGDQILAKTGQNQGQN